MKKIFLFLIMSLLLINVASAFTLIDPSTWDDKVIFHKKTAETDFGYYEITDTLLWLFNEKPVKTIKLIENDNSILTAWNIKEMRLYEASELFDKTEFFEIDKTTKKDNKIKLERHSYRKWINYTRSVTTTNCVSWEETPIVIKKEVEKEVKGNSSLNFTTTPAPTCTEWNTSVSEETYEDWGDWEVYNWGVVQPGLYQVKTTVERIDIYTGPIDWIDTNEGHKLSQWAVWWNDSWEYKREISNLTGNFSALYPIDLDSNMNDDFSDVRFIDSDTGSIELNYTIANFDGGIGLTYDLFGRHDPYGYSNISESSMINGLVSYWKLDESSGAVIDSHGTNNGTNSGATPSVTGKLNTAYDFNGTNKITVTDNANLDFYGSDAVSINLWVNPTSLGNQRILSKGGYNDQAGWELNVDTDGKLQFSQYYYSGGRQSQYSLSSTAGKTLAAGIWQMITVTKESGGVIKIYIDNIEVNYQTQESYDSNTVASNVDMTIGYGSGVYFNGKIDEISIFNKNLSPTEIRNLYDQGLKNGLVSYWKLDESSGAVIDSHGTNNGTNTGATPSVTGKLNTAYDFNGTGNYIEIDDIDIWTSTWSMSAWITTDSKTTKQTFYAPFGTSNVEFGIEATKLRCRIWNGSDEHKVEYDLSSYTAGDWINYIATYDGNKILRLYIDGSLVDTETEANNPATHNRENIIGAYSSGIGTQAYYWNGTIDEVALWNTTLSQSDASKLYNATQANFRIDNQGEATVDMFYGNPNATTSTGSASDVYFNPVSVYYLDRNAFDSVGDNNGIISGATLTDGYINRSFDFDGTDDLIDLPNYNFYDSFSVSLWVYHDVLGTQTDYLSNDVSNTAPRGIQLYKNPTDQISFYDGDTGNLQSSTLMTASTWHHVVYTWDGTTRKIYLNGVEDASDSSGNLNDVTKNTVIGARYAGSSHHDGKIDELYIYDKALTSDQIYRLYSQSVSSFVVGLEEVSEGVYTTLNYPANNINVTKPQLNLSAYSYSVGMTQIYNVTLNVWNTTSDIIYVSNFSTHSDQNVNSTWTNTFEEGNYTWNVLTCGPTVTPACNYALSNRTFNVIFSIPEITIIHPTNDSNYTTNNINFTFMATDASGINNVSLYIDGILNETNSSGFNGTYIFSKILEDGNHNWSVIVNSIYEKQTISETNLFEVHTVAPTVTITDPSGDLGFFLYGDNETLNYNISEAGYNSSHFDSCWYTYESTSETCYQESANITNQSGIDGDCGLDYDGNYDGSYTTLGTYSNLFDGNWSTGSRMGLDAEQYFYVNYSIPTGITGANSIFKIEDTIYTVPVNDTCFNNGFLQFRFQGNQWQLGPRLACYNSTSWVYVYYKDTIANAYLYEEAIEWDFREYLNCSLNTTDFEYILDENEITVYAQDAFGLIGNTTANWSYALLEMNQTYSATAIETTSETFEINLKYESSNWNTVVGTLHYNGEEHLGTVTGSGDEIQMTTEFFIDTVETDTNKTFYWTIQLTNATGSYNFNSTSNIQTVSRVNFYLCDYIDNPQLFFQTFSTTDPTTPVLATFASAWTIRNAAGGDVVLARSYQDLTETNSTWGFCIEPNATTYTVSVAITADATDYTPTSHYIVDTDYIGTAENISIYLLNDSESTLTEFVVTDLDNVPIEDVYITIQRYDMGTDTYYSVGQVKTDSSGSDLAYLKWYEDWYKFVGVLDEEVVFTDGPKKVSGSPLTFKVGTIETSRWQQNQDIDYSLSFNNDTNNFVLTYIDVTGVASSSCLKVVKRNITSNYLICNTCETSTSATMYCNIDTYGNGTFIADFYITGSPAYIIDTLYHYIGVQNEFFDLVGNDNGTGMAIIMAGVVLSFFLITPALGVFGMILGMILSVALGFQPIETVSFGGIVIVGFIVMWAVKK